MVNKKHKVTNKFTILATLCAIVMFFMMIVLLVYYVGIEKTTLVTTILWSIFGLSIFGFILFTILFFCGTPNLKNKK